VTVGPPSRGVASALSDNPKLGAFRKAQGKREVYIKKKHGTIARKRRKVADLSEVDQGKVERMSERRPNLARFRNTIETKIDINGVSLFDPRNKGVIAHDRRLLKHVGKARLPGWAFDRRIAYEEKLKDLSVRAVDVFIEYVKYRRIKEKERERGVEKRRVESLVECTLLKAISKVISLAISINFCGRQIQIRTFREV
jgi:hypothetical protein